MPGTRNEDRPSSIPPVSRRLEGNELADYLVEIGTVLAAYGCPSYRTEDVIRTVAEMEGYRASPFALPTGLFVSLETHDGRPPLHRMERVEDWGVDLGRLTEIDEVFNDVAARKTSIADARVRLGELIAKPPPYPAWVRWGATAFTSAAAAVFFRGRLVEIVASAIAAIGIALMGWLMTRRAFARAGGRFLVDFFAGFFAASVAGITTLLFPHASTQVIVLAGVIARVPGMTFTTGLAELARKNLVSGGARLMEALVTLLSLLFGIALAVGIAPLVGKTETHEPVLVALSFPFQVAALIAEAVAFGVVFSVPRRYMWAAIISGATGYAVTHLSMRYFPGHLAAFAAALAVCTFANGLARFTERPAQLFQVPGMMLLVPGSFGFLSLGDFMRGNVIQGATNGFQMLLVGGALVMGVLMSNVILPARKLL